MALVHGFLWGFFFHFLRMVPCLPEATSLSVQQLFHSYIVRKTILTEYISPVHYGIFFLSRPVFLKEKYAVLFFFFLLK